MSATIQTVKKFSEETGISITKTKELIRQDVIPEVPREDDNCLQLINKQEFDRRLEDNLIEVPVSERSIKHTRRAVHVSHE